MLDKRFSRDGGRDGDASECLATAAGGGLKTRLRPRTATRANGGGGGMGVAQVIQCNARVAARYAAEESTADRIFYNHTVVTTSRNACKIRRVFGRARQPAGFFPRRTNGSDSISSTKFDYGRDKKKKIQFKILVNVHTLWCTVFFFFLQSFRRNGKTEFSIEIKVEYKNKRF